MARWQEHGPFVRDEAEMDDYMHEVAGRVGWLLTEVFALHSPAIAAQKDRLMGLGREFGLALQTVNIIRGMRKDFERGWIFVPETFCGHAGLDSVQLFDPAHEPAALQVLGMLTAKARRHLDNGVAYIRLLPRRLRRLRLFCIWPLLFAATHPCHKREKSGGAAGRGKNNAGLKCSGLSASRGCSAGQMRFLPPTTKACSRDKKGGVHPHCRLIAVLISTGLKLPVHPV